MNRRRMLKLGCGATIGFYAGSCGLLRRKKPNLVFVLSDQQRRHAVGFMQEDQVITPNLDRFAEKSLVLTGAHTAAPLGGPYRATLMTGRYPLATGVVRDGIGLRPDEHSFAQSLKTAGYSTGFIGKWELYDKGTADLMEWQTSNYRQYVPPEHRFGFEYWHAANCFHCTFHRLYYENDAKAAVDEDGWQPEHEIDTAIRFISAHASDKKPFALFISMVPPRNTFGKGFERHGVVPGEEFIPSVFQTQYHAPERYQSQYHDRKIEMRPNVSDPFWLSVMPGYLGACTGIDDLFGRLLKVLDDADIGDDTIVVYTSDHGDMLGSHNRKWKSIWYEESIGIPFVIRWPGKIRSGRNDLLFNSVDVMPTLLGMLGIPVPDKVEGTDLSGALLGKTSPKLSSALIGLGTWRALRTPVFTFVMQKYPNMEQSDTFYYDNKQDPFQLKEIRKGPSDSLAAQLRAELKGWLRRTNDPFEKLL